ncbi:hypothetical protein K8R61_02145, partial [bacterium]|nr:hypothetical protein [bacterium]
MIVVEERDGQFYCWDPINDPADTEKVSINKHGLYLKYLTIRGPIAGIFSDGWHADTHPQPSQPFVDCYNKNGGAEKLGLPWDNGESVFVHEWPSGSSSQDTIFLQDFINWSDNGHWYQLVLNQGMNEVFPVHNQILFFWHNNFGYQNYGEPTCNEYYATDWITSEKLVIQEFKKDGLIHYIGYNTQTTNPINNPREYDSYEFFDWDESKFHHYQSIPDQSNISDWESFKIGEETYLAVAIRCSFNGSSCSGDTNSKIYKWDGASFAEFQAIPTFCARDWESFKIDGETYLVVANCLN